MVHPTRQQFTPEEVAKECGVSGDTVRRWIREGKIRAIRLPGGRYRIPGEEAEKFVTWVETAE